MSNIDCWCKEELCPESTLPIINTCDEPIAPECVSFWDLCETPECSPNKVFITNSSCKLQLADPCVLFSNCFKDQKVSVDGTDTPWFLEDKVFSCDPTKLQISKEGWRLKFCLNINEWLVSAGNWCTPWYLWQVLEWVWCIEAKTVWCRVQVGIKDCCKIKPLMKIMLTADHNQFFNWNAGGANALPNGGYFIPRNSTIYETNDLDEEYIEHVTLDVSNYSGTQFPALGMRVKKKGWYRVSLKWSVDINNVVNAFRSIAWVTSSSLSTNNPLVVEPRVLLDAKYGAPSNLPLSETTTYSIDTFGNHLKQYQIWQDWLFLLDVWDTVHMYGRMDTYVAPLAPWTWLQGLVVWRHAGIAGGNLWGSVVLEPESGFNLSIEWVSDEDGNPYINENCV